LLDIEIKKLNESEAPVKTYTDTVNWTFWAVFWAENSEI